MAVSQEGRRERRASGQGRERRVEHDRGQAARRTCRYLEEIQEALRHTAEVDAHRITIETSGSEVILSGIVRSWLERHEAERVAWSEPGVTRVEDRIVVAYPWPPHFRRTGPR